MSETNRKRPNVYRMSAVIRAIIEDIPVYPEEARLCVLARSHGYNRVCDFLPTDSPIAEDDGFACFPNQKAKDNYLEIIRNL